MIDPPAFEDEVDVDAMQDEEASPPSSVSESETPGLSALRHNIQKKGKNSYYYAHTLKIDGPVWDQKEEPRLLARETLAREALPEPVTQYAWLDEDKKIKYESYILSAWKK